MEIYEKAALNAVSEEEFVKSMFALEFRAVQRTRKWYVEVFLPHAKKYKIETFPESWFCRA